MADKPIRITDQLDQSAELQEYAEHLQTVRRTALSLQPLIDNWLDAGGKAPEELPLYLDAVSMVNEGILTRKGMDLETNIANLRRPNPYLYGPR